MVRRSNPGHSGDGLPQREYPGKKDSGSGTQGVLGGFKEFHWTSGDQVARGRRCPGGRGASGAPICGDVLRTDENASVGWRGARGTGSPPSRA